jgi:acetyl esterase/lipase
MIRISWILIFLTISFSSSSEQLAAPQEYIVTNADFESFKLYVFEPKKGNRTDSAIITVHGGGWKWGTAEWTFSTARAFAEAGMLGVAVDYRLSNDKITPVNAFNDVCNALKWIRQRSSKYSIDPNKVAAYGVSAGGHLSSLGATKGCKNNLGSKKNGGPDLLLLWSPALDVENDGWFKKLLQGKGTATDNSPLATMNKDMPPVSIVQGSLDTLTPTLAAERFCKMIKTEKGICELNVYAGVGHLLTRNLENQEGNFDPDPIFVKDGHEKLIEFLKNNEFIIK